MSHSLQRLYAAESAIVDQLYGQLLEEPSTSKALQLRKPPHLKRQHPHQPTSSRQSSSNALCTERSTTRKPAEPGTGKTSCATPALGKSCIKDRRDSLKTSSHVCRVVSSMCSEHLPHSEVSSTATLQTTLPRQRINSRSAYHSDAVARIVPACSGSFPSSSSCASSEDGIEKQLCLCSADVTAPRLTFASSRTVFTSRDTDSVAVDSMYDNLVNGSCASDPLRLKKPPWLPAERSLAQENVAHSASCLVDLTLVNSTSQLQKHTSGDGDTAVEGTHSDKGIGRTATQKNLSTLADSGEEGTTSSVDTDLTDTETAKTSNHSNDTGETSGSKPPRSEACHNKLRLRTSSRARILLESCSQPRKSEQRKSRRCGVDQMGPTLDAVDQVQAGDEDARSDISATSDRSGILPPTKHPSLSSSRGCLQQSSNSKKTSPLRKKQQPPPGKSHHSTRTPSPCKRVKLADKTTKSSPKTKASHKRQSLRVVSETVTKKSATSASSGSRKGKTIKEVNGKSAGRKSGKTLKSAVKSTKTSPRSQVENSTGKTVTSKSGDSSRRKALKDKNTKCNVRCGPVAKSSKSNSPHCRFKKMKNHAAQSKADMKSKNGKKLYSRSYKEISLQSKKINGNSKKSQKGKDHQTKQLKNAKASTGKGGDSKKRKSDSSIQPGGSKRRRENDVGVDGESLKGAVSKETAIVARHKDLSAVNSSEGKLSLFNVKDMFSQLCRLEERAKEYDASMMQSLIPLAEKETVSNVYRKPAVVRYNSLYPSGSNQNSHVGGVWNSIFSKR